MKKADVIKKGLECCATAVCDSCPYKDCESYDECTGALTADALTLIQHYERVIAYQKKNNGLLEDAVDKISELIPKWISVEERLPEDGVNVIVHSDRFGGSTHCAYYRHGRKEWFECNGVRLIPDVWHWMPLPEPPKEE